MYVYVYYRYTCIYLFIYLFIDLFTYLFIYLLIYLLIYLFTYLCIYVLSLLYCLWRKKHQAATFLISLDHGTSEQIVQLNLMRIAFFYPE